MEIFAGVAVGLLVLTAWTVVIKTFLLWRRTRGVPELMLSVYLTGATAAGYPLAIAMSRIPAAENPAVHIIAQLVMSIGWVGLYLFTWKVFRPDAVWAKAIVVLMLGGVGVSSVVYMMEVTSVAPRAPHEIPIFTMLSSIPCGTAYLWTTIEAFAFYSMMKKRLSLGLTEPAVVNRVLLWGLMTLSALIALVVNMAALPTGTYMTSPIIAFSAMCGLVHAVCLFLAFHPPVWYRRWLETPATAEAA